MIILTSTGWGGTGSSASTDFFSEFSNVKNVSHLFECTFLHEPDGLLDLENAVREGHRFKIDVALRRFLILSENLQKSEYKNYFGGKFLEITYSFIENAFPLKWNGWWHRIFETKPLTLFQHLMSQQTKLIYLRKTSKKKYALYESDSWQPSYLPCADEYYSHDIEKFLFYAKEYVYELLILLNPENKEFLHIDQLLPPIHPELYFHFFEKFAGIKVVAVDRDPRDYFLMNSLFWGERYIPFEVNTFIEWYKQSRKEKHCKNDNIKFIYLEDFVYNYDKTCADLIDFAGLKNDDHKEKLKYLNPEKSKKNTLLFKKYKNYENEIQMIETELKYFLFDYSNCKVENDFGEKIEIEKPVVKTIAECDKIYKRGIFNPIYIFPLGINFVKYRLHLIKTRIMTGGGHNYLELRPLPHSYDAVCSAPFARRAA